MRPLTYQIFTRALEEGIAYGWRRAHKYADAPDPETIQEAVYDGVLNAVSEVFSFDDGLGDGEG